MSLDRLLTSLRPGGRDFEHLCKWLLENVPEYKRRLKQVWLWDEWPGGGSRDIGIDLVAETPVCTSGTVRVWTLFLRTLIT